MIRSIAGRGGMSTVYAAEDVKLPGKWWAVKASRRHAEDPRGFAEEASMLARLDHPFLPKVADFYPPGADGYSLLVTDFVRGENLQSLYEGGRLTSGKITKYCLQLCDLFAYLHGLKPQPVIYRDLKPANVMIDDQDNVRLIDFGIARRRNSGNRADTVMLGTVGFAAPEQYGGVQTDERTDLYTLGAMVFYLFTGSYYLPERGDAEKKLDGLCSEEMARILYKLMQKDPALRYSDAASLKADLETMPFREIFPPSPDSSSNNQPQSKSAGTRNQPHPAKSSTFSRTVVIGALYSGAGATFAGVTLCRVLARMGISNALIEFSTREPELYAQLYGDRYAPAQPIFLQDLFDSCGWAGKKSWTHGFTAWVPQIPGGDHPMATSEERYRLQRSLKDRIAVYDISADWATPGVAELCHQADLIIGVTGMSPAKLNGAFFRKSSELLLGMQKSGYPVVFCANRFVDFTGSGEWRRSMPFRADACIPELATEYVATAEWKGELAQDRSEYREPLQEALEPVLSRLLPDELLFRPKKSLRRLLGLGS
ncbi:serine/threonine protein kinase [Gorillibacterium massiliense]|uniref:serine/threonine protein kinase n=1 Tax=Gorillibacterium massiliense TaxID=1280390 RepID=UPI0004BB5ACB|nr:serine/threonine-protein kinase [Gorillibacterium massiliense]